MSSTFCIPSVNIQQKIASILSKVDELTNKIEQTIRQIQNLKKALLDYFFNKFGDYKTHVIRDIGANFGDAPFGSNLKSKDYVDTGIPVVRGVNIDDNKFYWKSPLYVTKEKFASIPRSHCNEGDLVFQKIGNSIGDVALMPSIEGHKTFLLSTNMMKMSVNPDIADIQYVYYYFSQDKI